MPDAPTPSPRATRPYIPGYEDYTTRGTGLLSWDWFVERFTSTRNYWLATTSADGRPHAMPVWGVWVDGRFLFSTGLTSRKARNLAANPHCVVHTEDGLAAAILEGSVTMSGDQFDLKRFRAAYEPKYSWDMSGFGEVFIVTPSVAFGVIETPSDETGSVTRWLFDERP